MKGNVNTILFLIALSTLLTECNHHRVEQKLIITSDTISNLITFKNEKKFHMDKSTLYPGAPSEAIRVRAQNIIDDTLSTMILKISSNPTKSYVLSEIKVMLSKYNEFDSEEQDQICNYCEYIFHITGIKSSDGILNKWRYGFKPQKTGSD